MLTVTESSYAKVNLYLAITAKRVDGFHDIETVMQSVSLADTVSITVGNSRTSGITLSVFSPYSVPDDRTNLAYRAAEAFLSVTGESIPVEIILKKKIPVQAGLGGGSSDAAAVLRAMNRLSGRPLSEKELYRLAGELGSDVPFCLSGGTAICRGRGELLTALPDPGKLFFAIVKGSECVPTVEAYRMMDACFSDFRGGIPAGIPSVSRIPPAMRNRDLSELSAACFNLFEKPVFLLCPEAKELSQRLSEYGAVKSLLAGSGAAVFGIFPSETAAKHAVSRIPGAVYAESVRAVPIPGSER